MVLDLSARFAETKGECVTTVIAVEKPSGVLIGWDSQTSVGSEKYDSHVESGSKMFVHGSVVYLFTGTVRDKNILKYADLPSPEDDCSDVDRWVTNTLAPAIREALKDMEATQTEKDERLMESALLIVVSGRVYSFAHHFGWARRADGIYTSGSGEQFAKGALKAGVNVGKALLVAASCDRGTGGILYTARVSQSGKVSSIMEARR